MKLFIYKLLITLTSIFVLYHLTIGYHIRSIENDFTNFYLKEKIFFLREKIKKEIKNSLKNENILNKEDAEIVSQFIVKILKELNLK